jgi:hypothetical protein
MRDPLWKCRHDHLVDVGRCDELTHCLDWIRVTDHRIDALAGRVLQERYRELNDELSFLSVRIPVRPRDQEGDPALAGSGSTAHLGEQQRGCRRAMCDHEYVWLGFGHTAIVPLRRCSRQDEASRRGRALASLVGNP